MNRRGVALLLVLGMLVLVTSSLGLLALGAAQKQRASSITARECLADDLLRSAEPLVALWLARQSGRAVSDPDESEPRFTLFDLSWSDDDVRYTLRAAAWDQLGVLPLRTSASSPLWFAYEAPIRDLAGGQGHQTLLDLRDRGMPIHPSVDGDVDAIGGRLAVRPRSTDRSSRGTAPAVNINTASRPLLEAALRLAQRGDLATILKAREEDRVSPAPPPAIREREEALVNLTGRSTLWGVRVDATVDGIERSWWTLYESNGGRWEVVERHAIPE